MTDHALQQLADGPEIRLCDPHFHLWDLHQRPNPNLGDPATHPLPAYRAEDYSRDMATLPAPLKLVSRIHVETVVGQMAGGPVIDTVEETQWVCAQLEPSAAQCPFSLVAYVHLARDTAASEAVLERHLEVAGSRLRGVRMILNHHPDNPALTWPQVEKGDFIRSALFAEGLALLASRNLSFDLSCNPHQIEDAAAVLAANPKVPIIVNHLGFFHDGEDQAHEGLWRAGIDALAGLPQVFIKLSMLWFARDAYPRDPEKTAKIRDLVREVIDKFGTDRCMFASNYPVDKTMDIPINTLYSQFLQWSADLSAADRDALFHGTAVRAYGLSV